MLKLTPVLKMAMAVCGLLLLQSCSHAWLTEPVGVVGEQYETLLNKLPGIYSNRLQYQAADDALKIAPELGSRQPWIDHQYAEFKRVNVPSIAGEVIALEWLKRGPGGEVSRQRLWSFRLAGSQVLMDFYSFKTSVDFLSPVAFAALTKEDLIAYGDKCALPMRVADGEFRFAIPDTCRITSRSGRDMILSANITLAYTSSSKALSYSESGRLVDGTPVFAVPGGRAYAFIPLDGA